VTLEQRTTAEIFYDIIRAIHMLGKAGDKNTLYAIGYQASVPNNRLKVHLLDLEARGLVTSGRSVTASGYEYCDDYARNVSPFLLKYRFNRLS